MQQIKRIVKVSRPLITLRAYTHYRHFCAQYFDEKMKRLFDNKILFSSKYCSAISKYFQTGMNRTDLSKNKYFQFTQEKNWTKNVFLSFYGNIFLSFYHNIVCKKMSGVCDREIL